MQYSAISSQFSSLPHFPISKPSPLQGGWRQPKYPSCLLNVCVSQILTRLFFLQLVLSRARLSQTDRRSRSRRTARPQSRMRTRKVGTKTPQPILSPLPSVRVQGDALCSGLTRVTEYLKVLKYRIKRLVTHTDC